LATVNTQVVIVSTYYVISVQRCEATASALRFKKNTTPTKMWPSSRKWASHLCAARLSRSL